MFSQYSFVQLLNYSVFEQFCLEIYKPGTSMLSLGNYMRDRLYFSYYRTSIWCGLTQSDITNITGSIAIVTSKMCFHSMGNTNIVFWWAHNFCKAMWQVTHQSLKSRPYYKQNKRLDWFTSMLTLKLLPVEMIPWRSKQYWTSIFTLDTCLSLLLPTNVYIFHIH
jgi:hypothetical protein